MNIWFGRRLRILAWHVFRAISRSHQQQERARIAQQKQPRVQVQAPRASVAQQTKATAPQHITRQEQHEREKQLKHATAAHHAESRRYLLPGEEYKANAPRGVVPPFKAVEPTSRVAMFTQVPQAI